MANLDTDDFEEVLSDARAEGNLSRANVAEDEWFEFDPRTSELQCLTLDA